MSRDFKDIPEAFRRAFEEDWVEGEKVEDGGPPDNGGSGGRRPPPPNPFGESPWWLDRRVWIGGAILFVFLTFNWAVSTYTEWLWFGELEYQSVWWTRWGLQIGSFAIFFLIAALTLWVNWWLAQRRAEKQQQTAGLRPLQIPGLNILINMIALFLAFVFGLAGSSQWEQMLRYLYRVDFGVADPIFNRDISFFLFELPMFRFVQGWLMPILLYGCPGYSGHLRPGANAGYSARPMAAVPAARSTPTRPPCWPSSSASGPWATG
jgi:hypothetical protein